MTLPINSVVGNNVNLNTNPSSLIAQLSLSRNNERLSTVIDNLSTGLRVTSGRDDPGGFITSCTLRGEIITTKQAITNCSRASSITAVVDGALNQVNQLLIEIRGYVTEAANTGANDSTILASLQLQLDACLDSIDRIAETTSFMGQKLLDGSLDFTTYGVESQKIPFLEINQADFGGRWEKDISVKVLENAQPAFLFYSYGALAESTTLEIGGNLGYTVFSFDRDATVDDIAAAINQTSDVTGVAASVLAQATSGHITISSVGLDNDLILTASQPGTIEGNFVVQFLAPKEGNENLALNVVEGYGNEPTQIEVVLQTESWTPAQYHYNGENDGIPNNEFNWVSKIAGSAYNDVQFEINNIQETGGTVGLTSDLWNSPKKITINVDYNVANPNDPKNTTVNDLQNWLENDPILSTYFALEPVEPSDGTGPIIPSSPFVQTQQGVDGGTILTTAEQVAILLNTSPLLQDAKGNGRISASLPTGSTGLGTVTPFQYYAYFGSFAENNQLQFLSPNSIPNIRFVSNPGTELSLDYETFPATYGKAHATVQGLDPNTTFTLKAKNVGEQYDGIGVIMRDGSSESALFDPVQNAVVLTVDFSGRQSDPTRGPFDLLQMQEMIETSPSVGSLFQFVPQIAFVPSNPPVLNNSDYLGIDARLAETTGGLVDSGLLLVHLETDINGNIRTTAADLVRFFEKPTSEKAKQIIEQLGISVSLLDPNNSGATNCGLDASQLGLGVLQPTYSPSCPGDPDNLRPDIVLTSVGLGTVPEIPSTITVAKNGINAVFQITAKRAGEEYNNVAVQVVADDKGPRITFDPISKQLAIGVNPNHLLTANDIVDLINKTPEIGQFFSASIPDTFPGTTIRPDGTGLVRVGDQGMMQITDYGTPVGTPMWGNTDQASVGLAIFSTDLGSNAFVAVKSLQNTNFSVRDSNGTISERSTGFDVVALINNIVAVGNGQIASTRTSDLDMSIWIDSSVQRGEVFGFRITGGGALMQLGPQPDSSSQVRIALKDLHVAQLGGVSGSLSELRYGGPKDLFSDTNGAFKVIEEVIQEISFFRGRIGAFQKEQVERTSAQMNDTLEIAISADSMIRDTDFASASSELARLQVMIQAGVSVLQYPLETAKQLLTLLQR